MLWAAPLGRSAEWAEPTNVDPARSTVAAERRIFRIEFPVGMSDERVRGSGQAFPARSRFFHLPLAKWLPHVTSARRDMSYSAEVADDRDQSSGCCVRSSTGLISAAWIFSPKCSIAFVSAGRCF